MFKPEVKRSRLITSAVVAAAVLVFIVAAAVIADRNPDHRFFLSMEEWEWLSQHDGKITIASDPNFPPVDFIDAAGRHDGLAEDLFQLIEQRLNIKFVRVNPSSWDDLMVMAREKKVELVKCAVKTSDRTKYLLFSQPYMEIPTVIIVRSDNQRNLSIKDLSGMKVAVTRGYSIHEHLARNFPLITILPVENDKVALESVSSGESDAAISDLPTSSFFIRKFRIGNLRISGETGYVYRFAFGCRDDLPMLNSIMIKVLDSVSSSEREALSKKWIPFDRNEFLFTRQFWILVIIAAGLVLGVFGGIRLWDFALMIRVKEKTHQLEEHRHRLETLVSERDAEIRERIITEEALRESEERFRSYFELPFVGIAVLSSDGGFINVNLRFCTIVGYSQKELSLLRLSDITAPEDLEWGISEQCNDALGMKAVYERRYLRRDGSSVDIEVAHMRINERRGRGFYNIVVVRDLSEKNKS